MIIHSNKIFWLTAPSYVASIVALLSTEAPAIVLVEDA